MTRRSKDPKSGYRLTCAANGVDHKRCVLVLKTGCVTDAKCMSQRKIMKTVIALKKKTCISS